MKKIQISLTIDTTDSKQREMLNGLMDAISQQSENCSERGNTEPQATDEDQTSEEPEQVKANKKAPVKVKVTKKAKTNEEVTGEETEESTAESESDISYDDIRELMSHKIENHRSEIKAKLTELGSKNLTRLDPAKYEEFFQWLKTV